MSTRIPNGSARTAHFVAASIGLAVAMPAMALADPRQPEPDASLPGVDRSVGASAVTPLPEPDEALPAGSTPGSFRVGDWDVTISGSISYEIGTSTQRDRR